jgi:seryl-tRNA synthetase
MRLMAEVAKLKEDIPALEAEQAAVEKELNDRLAEIPNMPADDVPDGTDEKGNVERKDHAFGEAEHQSRRSSISNWARRSASWISRRRRSSPARALSC